MSQPHNMHSGLRVKLGTQLVGESKAAGMQLRVGVTMFNAILGSINKAALIQN